MMDVIGFTSRWQQSQTPCLFTLPTPLHSHLSTKLIHSYPPPAASMSSFSAFPLSIPQQTLTVPLVHIVTIPSEDMPVCHGVQSTGCMDNEAERSRGVLCSGLKTDQFRLDPTQSCAPGRRYGRVSSGSSPRSREVLQDFPTPNQPLLAVCRMPNKHHLYPYSHPTHHSYD